MDINTNALAKRLTKLQSRNGGGSNIWFKATEEKKVVRIVPYLHTDDNLPFFDVGYHYNVAGVRSLICPNITFGDPCPICELAEKFRMLGGTDNWNNFRKFQAKVRTYSPVIIRGEESEGVKLWGYGSTIATALIQKFMSPDWGNLADPKTGRDIEVWSVPKGKSGNDTQFPQPMMDVKPNQTKLMSATEVKELLENMPDFLNDDTTFKTMTYDQLIELVAKLDSSYDDHEENDFDDDQEDPTSDSTTDLKTKLNSLLDEDD